MVTASPNRYFARPLLTIYATDPRSSFQNGFLEPWHREVRSGQLRYRYDRWLCVYNVQPQVTA